MILKYKHLEDGVLLIDIGVAAKKEKAMTLELIEYLFEVNRRKLFATKSYSSLFKYAVEELKYSESQASERVNAVELLKSNPEVKALLEKEELTLTSAAQIQRFIKAEKKVGNPLVPDQKSELIEKCAGQSKRDIEKILIAQSSDQAKYALKESKRQIVDDRIELKFSVGTATQQKLERVQELLGTQTLERLFDEALRALD